MKRCYRHILTLLRKKRLIGSACLGLLCSTGAGALPWEVPALDEHCRIRTAPQYKRDRAETAFIQAQRLIAQCAAESCERIDLTYDMSCVNHLEELPEAIAELDHLRIFTSGSAPLRSYMPLEGVQGLEMLVLSSFTGNLSQVPALRNLKKLTFAGEGLITLEGIQKFRSLRELHISSPGFSDLSPLDGMHWIEYLHLDDTNVSDLDPLVRTFEEYGDSYDLQAVYLKATPLARANALDIWRLRLPGVLFDE